MATFKMSDAFHIVEPLLDGTKLTAWIMAPMYALAYAIILLIIELIKKKKIKSALKFSNPSDREVFPV